MARMPNGAYAPIFFSKYPETSISYHLPSAVDLKAVLAGKKSAKAYATEVRNTDRWTK